MSRRALNLTGKMFGRWTVLRRVYHRPGRSQWLCRCSCGIEKVVYGTRLKAGKSGSCGCLQKELASKRHTTHGCRRDPLYDVWRQMILRCNAPLNKAYHRYGGRGIHVCSEWSADVLVFIAWAKKSGYVSGLTLDRADNDGHYEPNNCRWVTMKEQQRNRRDNVNITYNGETLCLSAWAERFGVHRDKLRSMLQSGKSMEDVHTELAEFILRKGLPFVHPDDLPDKMPRNPKCGKAKRGYTFHPPHRDLSLADLVANHQERLLAPDFFDYIEDEVHAKLINSI